VRRPLGAAEPDDQGHGLPSCLPPPEQILTPGIAPGRRIPYCGATAKAATWRRSTAARTSRPRRSASGVTPGRLPARNG
jgi:hypothetical protein